MTLQSTPASVQLSRAVARVAPIAFDCAVTGVRFLLSRAAADDGKKKEAVWPSELRCTADKRLPAFALFSTADAAKVEKLCGCKLPTEVPSKLLDEVAGRHISL